MNVRNAMIEAAPAAHPDAGAGTRHGPGLLRAGFTERLRTASAAGMLLLAIAGCASRPETPRLAQFDPAAGYRYSNLAAPDEENRNSDELFVIVTISGGGMRAAALGYGVMEQLRSTTIVWNGRERSLLDEVDVIAGVSFGALLAASYAAYGDELFAMFPDRLLYRNVGRDLKLKLLSPANLLRIASPAFSRSDLVAEYYDETVFHGLTFGDLLARNRGPLLVIGATDLGQGWSFPFTQGRFDAMCADMAAFSLARAVAASSAFPGAFSSITLKNRAGSCGYDGPARLAETGPTTDIGRRLREHRRAEVLAAYRDSDAHPYILVSDGVPTDNIGLRTVLEALEAGQGGWRLSEQLRAGVIRKLIVVAVDATGKSSCIDETNPDDTGVLCEIYVAANVPIDDRSLDTWGVLERLLNRTGYPDRPPRTYYMYAGFSAIPEADRRGRFARIPTDLVLPRGDVDALRAIAGELLQHSPDMMRLRAELSVPAGAPAR